MRLRNAAVLLSAFWIAGCDMSLDLTNPNAATERTATGSLDGIIATSLGMQDQFASSVLIYVRAPSLVTDEWGLTTRSLAADQSLYLGSTIEPVYGVVSGPYYTTYRVARTADIVLEAVSALDIGTPFAVGLNASAKLFKAMALGMSAMQYEELPLGADPEGAPLVPRAEVFAEVLRLLESARTDLDRVTDADLAGFRLRAISPGFDLRNTVNAMLARYYLYTDNPQAAIDAANRVNLSVVSVLAYPDPESNPIYDYSVTLGYTAPLRSWARRAEPNDQRIAFWADTSAAPAAASIDVPLGQFRLYNSRNAPFPVYLPGEMLLIKAEAEARRGNVAEAVRILNELRARSGTATTPGAQLPSLPSTIDTRDEVFAQIARERTFELYSQGLRWEDLRRLGQYIGVQPKHDFLPTPQSECLANPNANC